MKVAKGFLICKIWFVSTVPLHDSDLTLGLMKVTSELSLTLYALGKLKIGTQWPVCTLLNRKILILHI
jgi:hypothetical protein